MDKVSSIRSHIFNGTPLRTSSRRPRDNRCTPRKPCSCATLSITNTTRTGLETNPGHRGGKSATHRLSHDMAHCQRSIRRPLQQFDVLTARVAQNRNIVKYSPNRLVLLQYTTCRTVDRVDCWCLNGTIGILGQGEHCGRITVQLK
jgi:hypothetical protein